MKPILVVDACSIINFQKYLYFDKYNGREVYSKLVNFLLSKIKSGEIIIIDKVYNELNTNWHTEKLKEIVKPFTKGTLSLFQEVQELIKNNQRKEIIQYYSSQEIETNLRKYEELYADLYLVAYCKQLKKQQIKPILITEETFRKDDKIIDKIPTICKKEGIECKNIPYSLFEIYKNELKFELNIDVT